MKKVLVAMIIYLIGLGFPVFSAESAMADPATSSGALLGGASTANSMTLQMRKVRLLGINYHQLDDHTRLLGWQLKDGWFFGRSRAESSEVALVWKKNSHDQLSLSKDGLRFLRRF
jgi:hypothetical protein